MKKLMLMLSISILAVGCSNDGTQSDPKDSQNGVFKQKGLIQDLYPEFSDLLKGLYDDKYDVGTEQSYVQNGESYYVHKVSLGEDGEGGLAGYFVKSDSDSKVVYIDYKESLGTIDHYEFNLANQIVKTSFDLTENPVYIDNGFSPDTTALAEGRFFGWGEPFRGDCEKVASDGNPCSKAVLKTYYAFWIPVDTDPVLGSGGVPLREPCDCP